MIYSPARATSGASVSGTPVSSYFRWGFHSEKHEVTSHDGFRGWCWRVYHSTSSLSSSRRRTCLACRRKISKARLLELLTKGGPRGRNGPPRSGNPNMTFVEPAPPGHDNILRSYPRIIIPSIVHIRTTLTTLLSPGVIPPRTVWKPQYEIRG